MDIDKIFSAIWEGKEWIFSGIGVVALGFIGKRIIGKKSGENSDTYTVKSEMHDNNNVSGEMDLDGIVTGLTDAVNEAVDIIAEGVHE